MDICSVLEVKLFGLVSFFFFFNGEEIYSYLQMVLFHLLLIISVRYIINSVVSPVYD